MLFGEEERRTFLRYIASESERLTSIVDALLNVARLDTGDLQVDLAPTDVGSVVSEVVGGVPDPTSNGHRVRARPARGAARGAGRRDKLRQMLSALVDNAVKFSPYGGTVTVAARRTDNAVEVTVEDEGVGIPQSEQELIFSKFYRGGDASSGTGLGLFIARGLVSKMGGHMSVESEEGKGSQFTFELPLAAAPRRFGRNGEGYSDGVARGGFLTRVLVIDDEAPIRLLCRVNLEAEKMEVVEANDGPTGLEEAKRTNPDVILLDVMMPDARRLACRRAPARRPERRRTSRSSSSRRAPSSATAREGSTSAASTT